MAQYRCEFRDARGKVFGAHDIEASNDGEAIEKCRELSRLSEFVLWCGDRRVETRRTPAA